MKTIEELWGLLKDVELVQVRPIEMEALYKHCFEFKNPQIVEIGSAHGASSIILAEAAKELKGQLYCIDSYPEDYYAQEKFGDYARQAFIKNAQIPYMGVLNFFDMTSEQAAAEIRSEVSDRLQTFIDVLFIDGDHDYEAVKRDIANFFPLVRSGGYIGFHDYFNPSFGVRQAVDELVTPILGQPAQFWDLAVFYKL